MKNLKELTTLVAKETGFTKKDTELVIRSVFSNIADILVKNEEVTIPSFGKFGTDIRAHRTGRNPQTGEVMDIPDIKVAKFKPSKVLKEMVRA